MQTQKTRLPLNLQFFAEPGEVELPAGGNEPPAGSQQQVQTPSFDYQKLADIISGKQSVTEDTVLKNYFKQQGLSQDEAKQAISDYKQQKAANQPDVGALQTQLAQAHQQAQQAVIERDAYFLAGELGVDSQIIPYILKLADMSGVVGEDGKVAQDKLKESLNKVLEKLPQLKQQTQTSAGFVVGASGGTQTQTAVDEQLNNIFGVKKN